MRDSLRVTAALDERARVAVARCAMRKRCGGGSRRCWPAKAGVASRTEAAGRRLKGLTQRAAAFAASAGRGPFDCSLRALPGGAFERALQRGLAVADGRPAVCYEDVVDIQLDQTLKSRQVARVPPLPAAFAVQRGRPNAQLATVCV